MENIIGLDITTWRKTHTLRHNCKCKRLYAIAIM